MNWPILAILALHFFADFVLQNRWMGNHKSHNWRAMLSHIGVYTACFTICFGPQYGLINGALHLVVDSISSRVTARLWKNQQVYWFFVVIGLDQFAHQASLIITWGLFH